MENVLKSTGDDIVLPNGVTIKVCVEVEEKEMSKFSDIVIKTYIKMKTSGEYKLYFTQHLGSPDQSQVLTNDEIMQQYTMKTKE